MAQRIAFLHTSPVHVPTFSALMQALAPEAQATHLVREDLLADAQKEGVDSPPLIERVRQALAEAGADGSGVVVCTCSTIGGVAEEAGASRIDRAMADQAVRSGPHVRVVAALHSTLAPTAALLQSSAERAGTAIAIDNLLVSDAWPHFQAGRQADYIDAIVEAVMQAQAAAPAPGAVVLAQASMAPAAELLARRGVKALASPRLGVEHALALCRSTTSWENIR